MTEYKKRLDQLSHNRLSAFWGIPIYLSGKITGDDINRLSQSPFGFLRYSDLQYKTALLIARKTCHNRLSAFWGIPIDQRERTNAQKICNVTIAFRLSEVFRSIEGMWQGNYVVISHNRLSAFWGIPIRGASDYAFAKLKPSQSPFGFLRYSDKTGLTKGSVQTPRKSQSPFGFLRYSDNPGKHNNRNSQIR